MPAQKQIITDAEYEIMKVLWSAERKMMVGEVLSELTGSCWSASTISTFLLRLVAKGVVAGEKRGRANYYYPLLKRREYEMNESISFLEKIYNGSVTDMVSALYDNGKISREDILSLKRMLEIWGV